MQLNDTDDEEKVNYIKALVQQNKYKKQSEREFGYQVMATMNTFGVVQKNVLCQYIQGQTSSQSEKKYLVDKLSPQMLNASNNNVYPFSAFAFVEVLPKNQNLVKSQTIDQSPLKQQKLYQSESEQDEQIGSFNNKPSQPTLVTGVLIGPQHLLVQLDNPQITCSDLRVTIGSYGQVNVAHIFRSSYLALNRFSVLLLEQPIGVQRGYLGMLACKRTFNTRYFYALDSIIEPDVQSKKKGVIISGFMKNQSQSFQFLYNSVSDIMGGVLINVQIDRSNLNRESDNFARNHWPICVNDPETGFCVVGFTQELNSKGIKGILINSEQFNQIVLFTQNYQPQDILRIPCCAQLSEDEYKVDVKSIKAHRKQILSVARINYRLIVSSDNEKKLKIWQVDSKKVYSEIDLSSNCHYLVAEGKNLYVCLQDKIQIWDWKTSQVVSSIQCPYPITNLIKINSRYMVSADKGGQIIVWKNDEIQNIIFQPSPEIDCTEVTSMVSFNEKFIAVGFVNGKIRIIDLSSGGILKVIENGHYVRNKQNAVNTLLVFNQEFLISGTNDSTVIIWSLSQEYKILKKIQYDGQILSISALNEKEMLIAHGYNISVYNLSTGKSFNLTEFYQPHQDLIAFCTTIDHEQFSTADLSGTIRFWKIDKVNEEIYESISQEELLKISDQLRSPQSYNYFFFRNFMQFQQSPQAVEKQQPLSSKEKKLKEEIEQSKISQIKYQQELDQVSQILREKDNDSIQKNNQILKLQKEVDALSQKLSIQNTKLQQQVDLCQQLQSQIRNASSNDTSSAKELELWKNKYHNLQDQQQKQNRSPEQNRNLSNLNTDQLQKEREQLQRLVKQQNQTISNLEEENSKMKRKIDSFEQQLATYIQNGRNSPTKNSDQRDKELQRQTKQLNQTISNLENDNNALQRQIDALELEKKSINKSPSRIQKGGNLSNSMIDQNQDEIIRLKQDIQNQIQQYELLSQQYESQRLDLMEKNHEIEGMKNSIKTLKDSFNEIQSLSLKKHKLDLAHKDREKEEVLNILNEQRLQNQIIMKNLEQTREQHIKNLQESNKERRQMLENQNSLTNSINPSATINRNNSFTSRYPSQQPYFEEGSTFNQNESIYLDRSKTEQKTSADIQNFKQEISMIQGQISTLKKSILEGSSSKGNLLNQSYYDNNSHNKKQQNNDRFINNPSADKTAQKHQRYYLDPHSQTPLQNKRAPSTNLINSSYDKNVSNVSQDYSQQQQKNSKAQLQQMLQSKLQDLQDELARRKDRERSTSQLQHSQNDKDRGRSQKDTNVNYSSPQKYRRDITSSPNQKQQRVYGNNNSNIQGSVNSSIVITGKSIGDLIGSPLKLNKCNIEIDISAVEEVQQQFNESYSSPERNYLQQQYPHITVQFESDGKNKQRNRVQKS